MCFASVSEKTIYTYSISGKMWIEIRVSDDLHEGDIINNKVTFAEL